MFCIETIEVLDMKLESIITKRRKGKIYRSYRIILPKKLIEELKWKVGTELEARVEGKKLTIEPL